jgi:hypothetical protein
LWFFLLSGKDFSMVEIAKYTGLCETCDHDATCTLRRSSQLKIVLCEEFSAQAAANKPFYVDETAAVEPADAKALGLCANCLNRITCGFPNARNNVLFCEEHVLDETGLVPPVLSECSRSAA